MYFVTTQCENIYEEKSMNTNKTKDAKFSTFSVVMMVVSVCAYYTPNMLDRQFNLSSGVYRVAMLIVAVIAIISALSAVVAVFKVPGWKKLLFVLFLPVSLGICGIALLAAGLAVS